MKKNYRYYRNWFTTNSSEDVEKYLAIHSYKSNWMKPSTLRAKRDSVTVLHNDFPQIRLYDFHKQSFLFFDNYYSNEIDYCKCTRLPDGYFFNAPNDIFLIEIENTSRVTSKKMDNYFEWVKQFENIKKTNFTIIEFNRFGNFQRVRYTTDKYNKDVVDYLKSLNNTIYYRDLGDENEPK